MTVYRRQNSELYYYDFWISGERYTGPTGTTDLEEARQYEEITRGSVQATSSFCRAVLKKAKLHISRRAPNGYVYMLQSGYFIKIGHSNDPAERIKTIATAMPLECELLFYVPGSMKLERRLHAEFSACHYQKEWFFLCGKLKQFIAEFESMGDNRSEGVTPTTIPVNDRSVAEAA